MRLIPGAPAGRPAARPGRRRTVRRHRRRGAAGTAPAAAADGTPRPAAARRRPHRLTEAAVATVTALALTAAVVLLHGGLTGTPPPRPPADQARPRAAGPAAAPLPRARPDRVRIPALRVDAPLTGLGLTPDGHLDPPPPGRADLAGWYADGTAPGERGTAILAGHVDTATGPGVFYRLGALRRGRTVAVDRADGSTAVFRVDAIGVYRADDFPDERVYGAATRPELRLITCGGPYSSGTGYRANVVVFAHLTGRAPRPSALTAVSSAR